MTALEHHLIQAESFSPEEAAEWLTCMRELVKEGHRPVDLLTPYGIERKFAFAKDLYNFKGIEHEASNPK